MDAMAGLGPLPAPTHEAKEFLAYEKECRSVLQPRLAGLLDMAEAAGWNRRAMFAAQKMKGVVVWRWRRDRGPVA
ncbi:hypothetical protein X740_26000 [Mesorhizobium sp. LNHC221B00]|uniref:hypothetical protein n=1 Tax=Mesorhizobium sp. LNHC221B00 TaxID=1287233 RepID=UPI0003CF2BA7|nr:hypothetical protein [Mesorhizobium sp. LNHC221B00]ESY76898.1 hypothetical protein X740_26000 [Mesorhizobium sp. LNHC221B00]